MKVHIQFVEVGERLRVILDEQFDLTGGTALPEKGDVVWIYDKDRQRQFWVVERHWNIGNVIGMITIYVASTSEGARTI